MVLAHAVVGAVGLATCGVDYTRTEATVLTYLEGKGVDYTRTESTVLTYFEGKGVAYTHTEATVLTYFEGKGWLIPTQKQQY